MPCCPVVPPLHQDAVPLPLPAATSPARWRGVNRYGPATAPIETFLASCARLSDQQETTLRRAAARTWGSGPTLHLCTARDHAWARLQEAIAAHHLESQFQGLWQRLTHLPGGVDRMVNLGLADAVCALMLQPFCDEGPFRTVDAETLLAVWRSEMEDHAGARLALQLMPAYPCTPEQLWEVVAAAELPPAAAPRAVR